MNEQDALLDELTKLMAVIACRIPNGLAEIRIALEAVEQAGWEIEREVTSPS